jgi:teichuronic acid biosynthesis glycosyltransferase TuaG
LKNNLISVITPAYNAEKYVAKTIASVQSQTYSNWEMIVLDDGSTDRTSEIVQEMAGADERIRYVRQSNGRQGKARNKAISHATGEYLAFLDADDLWHPSKLTAQLNCIQEQKADVVFCSGWWLKDENNPEAFPLDAPVGLQDASAFYTKQLQGYSIPMLSAMVKRETVLSVGGFDEDLRIQNAEDYQLWLRLSDRGYTFYGMQDRLFYYRVHENQSTQDDSMAIIPALWATYRANLQRISDEEKSAIINTRLNRYLIHNLDTLPKTKIHGLLQCYADLLNRPMLAMLLKLCYQIRPNLLKKMGYRYLNLNEYDTQPN